MNNLYFMIKKVALVFFFMTAAMVGCQEKKVDGIINLSVSQFEERISNENAFLLDVRTANEVSGGYIEGAVFMDMMSSEFQNNYKNIPKNKDIYIYCRSGNRSRKVLDFLKSEGYQNVYHLAGGISAWGKENKKIKK